jgi:hypothetical protein
MARDCTSAQFTQADHLFSCLRLLRTTYETMKRILKDAW